MGTVFFFFVNAIWTKQLSVDLAEHTSSDGCLVLLVRYTLFWHGGVLLFQGLLPGKSHSGGQHMANPDTSIIITNTSKSTPMYTIQLLSLLYIRQLTSLLCIHTATYIIATYEHC